MKRQSIQRQKEVDKNVTFLNHQVFRRWDLTDRPLPTVYFYL